MRKFLPCLCSILFAAAPILTEAASASDESKDDNRLRNCGTVLKEILDVPDNIPHDLLDKADCVVVFPSVLKAAFIVGGSYGRGALSCRKFPGTMGRSHHDGSGGRQLRPADRRASDGFCLAGYGREWREGDSRQQGQTGRRRFRGGRAGWPRCICRDRRNPSFRNLELLKSAWFVCRSVPRGFHNSSRQWR